MLKELLSLEESTWSKEVRTKRGSMFQEPWACGISGAQHNYGFPTIGQALHWAPCELLELKFLWDGSHSKDLTQSNGGD